MASCLTFQTHYAFATSTTITKTAYSMPILTATTTPNTCALVVQTGAEYQTTQTNLTNAVSVSQTAFTQSSSAVTAATNANTSANSALSIANTASTDSTNAINSASTANTTANNALSLASVARDTATSAEELSQQALTLAQNINSEFGNFDYTHASEMWGFAFAGTFGLWYLAKNLGLIINAVRRW